MLISNNLAAFKQSLIHQIATAIGRCVVIRTDSIHSGAHRDLAECFASDLFDFHMDQVIKQVHLLCQVPLIYLVSFSSRCQRRNVFDFLKPLWCHTRCRGGRLAASLLQSFLLPDLNYVLHLEEDLFVNVVLVSDFLRVDLVKGALLAGVLFRLELEEFGWLHVALSTELNRVLNLIFH